MLRQLLAFEWAYHTRQISFMFALALATAMGMLLSFRLNPGPQVLYNAAANINYLFSFFALGSVFVLMVTCANAMLRDDESKMSELVFASGIGKTTLLFSRFVGAFGAAALVLLFATFGAMIGVKMPWVEAGTMGPFELMSYLWSYAVILLPSMLFCGAVIFSVATLSRNMIATYLSAIFIYVLYMVISGLGGSPMFVGGTPPSPQAYALAAKLDPFAIMTYFEQTQYWTVAQKNTQLLQLSGNLAFNRLLLLTVSILLLLGLNAAYRLKLPQQRQTKKPNSAQVWPTTEYHLVAPQIGWNAAAGAWWSAFKVQWQLVVFHWPFVVMLLLFGALVLSEMLSQLGNLEYGPAYYPSTGRLLNTVQFDVLPRFGALFIIYYGAEIFWRERMAGFNAFIDASPVSNQTLFSTKLAALCAVPLMLIVVTVATALLIQLSKGYQPIEPWLYLSLFYYSGVPLIMVAVLVLFVQSVSANKYLGMLLSGAVVMVAGSSLAGSFGLEHPLWHFAQVPVLDYSDMDGFSLGNDAFGWYLLYWGAWCFVFAVIGFTLWPRGIELQLKQRLMMLKPVRASLFAGVLAIIVSGGYIYRQTDFISSDDDAFRRAEYERKYKAFEHITRPSITAIKADIALYPQQRKYEIDTKVQLTNLSDKPMSQLMFSTVWGQTQTILSFATQGELIEDKALGVYLFKPSTPLQPNESIALGVQFSAAQSGFNETSFRNTIKPNGSHLALNSIFPYPGYRPGRELTNAQQRQAFQLPVKMPEETLAQVLARKGGDFSDEFDWADFEATVSTDKDQFVVLQGSLLSDQIKGERRFFHYKSKGKIRNIIALLSGRYAVRKTQHNGVSIEVYYHPEHGQNVDHMMEAAARSLDYFSTHYAPYPLDHLRITEVPVGHNSRFTGFASSGNMMISNYGGFKADLSSEYEVDQVYRRIAHEVAHQWWGYLLSPATIPGNLLMVETLAKYSEMRILAERFGAQQVVNLVDYEQRRYLRARANQDIAEQPIYRARGDQNHLFYSKGGSVMYRLTELLGAEVMNNALALFLQRHGYPHNMPTSLDFIAVLKAVAPANNHDQIDELLMQVVMYDFAIESITAKPLNDHEQLLTIQLNNHKYQIDEQGEQKDLTLHAEVEIASYRQYPGLADTDEDGKISQAHYRLKGGRQRLTMKVDKAARFIQIDPRRLYLDVKRENNLKPIK